MGLRDTARVHGAIMDVARLTGLSPDDCNILLVSSRTLYMIQNYGDAEVFFLGRYAKSFTADGRYTPVVANDAEAITAADAANNYGLEVVDMSCEIVPILNQIALALQGQSSTCDCVPNGPQPPQPPTVEGDPPPAGFTEYDPVFPDRKCKIANMMIDDLLELVTLLIVNNVEEAAALGLAVMSSLFTLVIAMMAAGPLGWGLAGLGTLATIIGFFLVSTVDLDEFKTLMETARDDLVCALYNAPNNSAAFSALRAVLSDAGASSAQLAFVDALNLINGLTALFFKPDDPMGQAIEDRLDGFTAITDCDDCAGLFDDWVLLPENTWPSFTTDVGTAGTGTILNDGTQFRIDSAPKTNDPGMHCIGAVVQGFYDSQTNKATMNSDVCIINAGTYEVDTIEHPIHLTRGMQCFNCVMFPQQNNPPGSVGEVYNSQLFFYQANQPFYMEFRIEVKPIICP